MDSASGRCGRDQGQGPTFRVLIGQTRGQQVLANVIQSTSGAGAQAVQTTQVVTAHPQTLLPGQSITSASFKVS